MSKSVNIDRPLYTIRTPPTTPILINPVLKMPQAQSNPSPCCSIFIIAASCTQLGILDITGCGFCLAKAQVYGGDGGVEAAHLGGRLPYPPAKMANALVEVPHVQVHCEFAGKLAN